MNLLLLLLLKKCNTFIMSSFRPCFVSTIRNYTLYIGTLYSRYLTTYQNDYRLNSKNYSDAIMQLINNL